MGCDVPKGRTLERPSISPTLALGETDSHISQKALKTYRYFLKLFHYSGICPREHKAIISSLCPLGWRWLPFFLTAQPLPLPPYVWGIAFLPHMSSE